MEEIYIEESVHIADNGALDADFENQDEGDLGHGPRLVDYVSAPPFMKHNEYIRTGFRAGHHTLSVCLRSIFVIHNETGNIWSHLIGFFLFVVLIAMYARDVSSQNSAQDLVWTVFFASCLCCMFFSASYHTLNCRSADTHRVSMLWDYFGIAFLIVGSFYPPIYFAFSCYPTARVVYLSCITLFGLSGMVGPCFPFFHAPSFTFYRNTLFVLLAGSGVVPLVHAHAVFPFTQDDNATMFLGIYLMYICYGGGVIVYLTKVPEKWYPGRYDIWFQSHQLWHVLVLMGALVHFSNCIGIYHRWSRHQGMENHGCN